MRVSIDENGYVTSWQYSESDGILNDSIEVDDDQIDHLEEFIRCCEAFKLEHDQLILNEQKLESWIQQKKKTDIRIKRAQECFPIINRGNAWYQTLSEQQKEELSNWYSNWLDAPQTMQIPEKPIWIK